MRKKEVKMKKENWLQAIKESNEVTMRLGTIIEELLKPRGFCKEYQQDRFTNSCEECPLHGEFCGHGHNLPHTSVFYKCYQHIEGAQEEARKLYYKIMSLKPEPEQTYFVGQRLLRIRGEFKGHKYMIVEESIVGGVGGYFNLVDLTIGGLCGFKGQAKNYKKITKGEMTDLFREYDFDEFEIIKEDAVCEKKK